MGLLYTHGGFSPNRLPPIFLAPIFFGPCRFGFFGVTHSATLPVRFSFTLRLSRASTVQSRTGCDTKRSMNPEDTLPPRLCLVMASRWDRDGNHRVRSKSSGAFDNTSESYNELCIGRNGRQRICHVVTYAVIVKGTKECPRGVPLSRPVIG